MGEERKEQFKGFLKDGMIIQPAVIDRSLFFLFCMLKLCHVLLVALLLLE